MSRFIEKLNHISQAVAQPMGFRTIKTSAPSPRMLLVAGLTPAENTASLAGLAAGADAVLLNAAGKKLAAGTVQKTAGSLPDIPWGISLEDTSGKSAKSRAISGCDFVVFSAARQVLATPGSETGRILRVDSSISEGLLRAINELPVDAVLVDDSLGDALTWQQLLLFQRFASLLFKPLLVTAPPKLAVDELKAIWETGVDGVVIEVAESGSLAELRQAADKLPSRKKGKAEAFLPRMLGETTAMADTEEEPEEEPEEE